MAEHPLALLQHQVTILAVRPQLPAFQNRVEVVSLRVELPVLPSTKLLIDPLLAPSSSSSVFSEVISRTKSGPLPSSQIS